MTADETTPAEKNPSDGKFLTAVTEAIRILGSGEDQSVSVNPALKILGLAAGMDRCYVFRNTIHAESQRLTITQIFEWCRDGIEPQIDNPILKGLHYLHHLKGLYDALSNGEPLIAKVDSFSPEFRAILERQQIVSIALFPIFLGSEFWGFFGFDDCTHVLDCSPDFIRLSQISAAAIGNLISKWDANQAMCEANAELQKQTAELQRIQRITLSLMEDAKAAQLAAAHASAAKSEFLAVMSHEMRTPLNGILGFTELIGNEDNPEVVRETIDIIRDSGRLLLNLISDVLDFSKIEAGHLELDPSPTRIRSVFSEVVTAISGVAMEKGLSFESHVEADVPTTLLLDDRRLRQILLNIVGNAVKFTDEGGVSVLAKYRAADDGTGTLLVDVSDTGIGIDVDSFPRIFQPFDQANRAVHRKFGGTGLGLSISKSLCQMMGGELTVQSTLGSGSVFSFHVKCTPVETSPATKEAQSIKGIPNLAGKFPLRVLIVDDVATNRLLAKRLLAKMGYAADLAVDGEDAVTQSAASHYDMILMDVFMPGIDGCEAAAQIRAKESAATRPAIIIGLSADVMLENQKRCLESGMNDFLSKPIRVPDFVEMVHRYASRL